MIPLIPEGCIVADLGCGSGDLAHMLAKGGRTVYGVDSCLPAFAAIPNPIFVESDLNESIRLPDNAVDVCVCLAVIEHLTDPGRFIAEVERILRSGGSIVMTTPTPRAKPVLEFLAYRLGLISKADIRDHKRYYCAEEIRALLSSFQDLVVSTFQCGMNTIATAVKPR